MSRVAATRAAKAQLTEDRGRARNALHAVTRQMLDEKICFESRLIHYLFAPEAIAAGVMLHELRSAENMREQYARWANWEGLKEVIEQIKLLDDLPKLEKLGFTLKFPSSLMKHLYEGHARPTLEDHRANVMKIALAQQLKFRCGQMGWYTRGLGVVAGMNHPKGEVREKTFSFFKDCDSALKWAMESGFGTLVKMAKVQALESPLMKWLREVCRDAAPGYDAVPEAARVVNKKMWSGMLNDKFMEDKLKEMREAEKRDTTTFRLAKIRAWQSGTNQKLIPQYEREEVETTCNSSVPSNWNVEKCFKTIVDDTLTQAEKEEVDMLEAVKKKESERKYTPESEQHRFGNLQCIVDLWRMDAADKVDDCWRSRLLPEGEIVTIGRGGIPWFVVRVYDNTVLL